MIYHTANVDAYAEVPYDGCAHRDTHPMFIRPIATLLGLSPAPPTACRVLELGCAQGRNLIPMAAALPGARFTGLDISAPCIEAARGSASALGLENIALHAADIAEVGEELGTFDYIIAHGVYSWLPPAARDRLMALCGALLAPEGVAYVSHNTYPGWHRRQALREMMLYHVRDASTAAERVRGARDLLGLLCDAAPPGSPSHDPWLHKEREFISRVDDSYLFHEHLAVHNDPCFVHELLAHAARHGLQFLGDAYLTANFGKLMPSALAASLVELSGRDRVAFEQYQDFALDRFFRKTLLCRQEAAISVPPRLGSWATAHVMSSLQRAPEVAPEPGCASWRQGQEVLTDINPSVDALLGILAARWPSSMPVAELFDACRALDRDGSFEGRTVEDLCQSLYVLAVAEMIEVAAVPVAAGLRVERPTAWPVARLEIAGRVRSVTTLHHQAVGLDPFPRALALLADGTRTRDELVSAMGAEIASDRVVIGDDPPDRAPRSEAQRLEAWVDAGLAHLRQRGLLA